MKRYIILSLILISMFTFSSCRKSVLLGVESSVYEEDNVKNIKIINNNVPIRSGCSGDASVLKQAKSNEKLKVINKVSDWYAVQLPDNSIGFVPTDQCKAVIDESQPVEPPTSAQRTPTQQQIASNNPDSKKNPTTNQQKAKKDSTVHNQATSEDEQAMLDLMNSERAANNLSPLQIDMEVTNVARVKSQDMIDSNYFSHSSPTYGSPFDMLKSFGVHYVDAGENIAGNQTVEGSHNALMNSPGHRANILKPVYTHVGIGIIDGGPYGKMFTQIFVSKPK